MKIYGHSNNKNQAPMELNEVTISANPELLREISKFLLQCADEMENNKGWEHEHFTSMNKNISDSPVLIVFNPNAK